MQKAKSKIAIIGVGFMGGSLALAIKNKMPKVETWGYARCQKSYSRLRRLKVVDRVSRDLERVVDGADMVVLGLPVELIIDYFKKIKPYLKKGAIIFDLGSSKKDIDKKARQILPKNVNFVGCHPLCGSEKSGAEFACEKIYQGSLCLITSSSKSSAVKKVEEFWKRIGCRTQHISPKAHDEALCAISHLPHLISFSYTSFVPAKFSKFAAGSFKDLTRISDSSALLWADIFTSNKKNILSDLKKFKKALDQFKVILESNDVDKIFGFIKKINAKHKVILKNLK